MGNKRPARTLVLYTDYCCPFSYIMKNIVDRYIDTAIFPPDIEYRFFDLREPIRTSSGNLDWSQDQAREDYFQEVRVGVDILREQRGVFLAKDTCLKVNSKPAHKISYFIKQNYPKSVFEAVHDCIFRRLWRGKADISQRNELEDVLKESGINEEKVDDILDDDDVEKDLSAYFRRVKQNIPRSSPTLVYQEQTISGAISLGDVRRLVKFAKGHPADEFGLNLIPHYMLPQHHRQ
ncbi:DsbA family oxidoreductase [Halorubrum sp. DTA98]|uniref:DsbA family oxidoreductase n=1 Tax=Halorubrum sp. DTA98 TaxID=3402163 RepID=UPI003AB03CBB